MQDLRLIYIRHLFETKYVIRMSMCVQFESRVQWLFTISRNWICWPINNPFTTHSFFIFFSKPLLLKLFFDNIVAMKYGIKTFMFRRPQNKITCFFRKKDWAVSRNNDNLRYQKQKKKDLLSKQRFAAKSMYYYITSKKQCWPSSSISNHSKWITHIFTKKSWAPTSIIFQISWPPINKGGSHYHFWLAFPFYTLWKHGFLVLSGVWNENNGQVLVNRNPLLTQSPQVKLKKSFHFFHAK